MRPTPPSSTKKGAWQSALGRGLELSPRLKGPWAAQDKATTYSDSADER